MASSRSACQKVRGVAVAGPAHHVRVPVAQVLPLGHAERAHRALELARPDLAQPPVVVGRVHVGDDDLAHLAAGAGDEHDATAGADGRAPSAAGADRLVVRMGVDGHQGGHWAGRGRHRVAGVGRFAHAEHRTLEPMTAAARDDSPRPRRSRRSGRGRRRSASSARRSPTTRTESAAFQGIATRGLLRSILVRRAAGRLRVRAWSRAAAAFDWPKLRAHLGTNRLSLPDREEAKAETGYERGAITPFGARRPWPVIVDASSQRRSLVAVGGGRPRGHVHLAPGDLIRVTGAEVVDIPCRRHPAVARSAGRSLGSGTPPTVGCRSPMRVSSRRTGRAVRHRRVASSATNAEIARSRTGARPWVIPFDGSVVDVPE